MKAILSRNQPIQAGTFGTFTLESGSSWDSLELVWDNNNPDTSCIPTGTYTCKLIDSPKHGSVYEVMNVLNRSMIEIHSANFAGSHGLQSQLLGCIALGNSIGMLPNSSGIQQQGLLRSKDAIAAFEDELVGQDFTLQIVWA